VEWLLLESLVAFVILVAIVAWTMGPLARRKRSRRRADAASGPPAPRETDDRPDTPARE
jgi:hypothetical protein